MTITTEAVTAIIYGCVDEINRQLPGGVTLAKTPQTILLGEGGVLDSLGLVTLLVSVEGELQAKLGIQCVVLDEGALADPKGHYHTIGRLAEWIAAKTAKGS